MSHRVTVCTTIVGISLLGILVSPAAERPLPDMRKQAQKLLIDGQYKEVLEIARELSLHPENSGKALAEDISLVTKSLDQLQQHAKLDSFFEEVIAIHSEDWYAYWSLAQELAQSPHYGFIVGGDFLRGSQRGGGQYVGSTERDRVQALKWFLNAYQLMPDETNGEVAAKFYADFSSAVTAGRPGGQQWMLQDLTDLETLPDYEKSHIYRFGGRRSQGAPVDEEGNPVYYKIPESWNSAKNDGERWRWLLSQIEKAAPNRASETAFEFAMFSYNQFGVHTLQEWGVRLPSAGQDGPEEETGTWALNTLGENETIARLASGVKRFELPPDYAFIPRFRELAAADNPQSESAYGQLARIFEDRQQYGKAAEMWRASIMRHGDSQNGSKQKRLDQIVQNWGQFEGTGSQPAGQGATIDYRFRNGNTVSFEAYELHVQQLLSDVKSYLKSNPAEVDWQKAQVDNIGFRIVQQNELKYRGPKVADWSLTLEPRPGHYDRRITVTTPLQKAGAYLLIAKMKDGNTSRIVIWLDDTAILKKQLDGKSLYYVADAITGEPIPGMKVEFFGWQQERIEKNRRQYRIRTQQHAEFTDAQGAIVTDEKLMARDLQWLATARNDAGRFAYLGFNRVWYSQYHHQHYQQVKTYIVTDRPVYRPQQTVKFKFWVREARYDQGDVSIFANKAFTVKIADPQGNDVFETSGQTDEYGGLAGEFKLPAEAKLGQYSLSVNGANRIQGSNHFRVEEYKKPEFEVTIETPDEPVQLGEKVTATIRAKYYFGAPVTNAKLQFKIERSKHDGRWFPITRWDWLYGNGYWWYAADYNWYPGFGRWGCFAPTPIWWNWNPDPPELVLDREVEIGENGTFDVEIDTELAKVLHGNSDHEYKITAEVTDASRRTIVGTGSVLVAREPFQVFAWTNRGHYQVGDTILASFQARTIDGKSVQGDGLLKLFKVNYQDGKPQEQLVEEWNLATAADGHAAQKINASAAGQYRLSYTVTSNGKSIEAGYLFVVRGAGFDGSDYRFNDLEMIANKQTYQPGEQVELLINTDRIGSTVLLFVRPSNGVYQGKPQVLKLEGKSTSVKIDVTQQDMPNFFIEAITIADGDVHTAVQQIAVPPQDRLINVEVIADQEEYLPGAAANVQVKLTNENGEPFVGSVLLSVYDRAVEYISGGTNVPEIHEFFWNWKRNHRPHSEHNLDRYFSILLKQGEEAMSHLGAFGHEVADRGNQRDFKLRRESKVRSMMKGGMVADGMMLQAAPMAAAAEAEGGLALRADAAPGAGAEMVAPTVRQNFADTAFWASDLATNENGLATVSFTMPDNLSAWKLRAWGIGHGTKVGEGSSEVITSKNLIVRLQAPRFFVEKDEVVLSAVVHNYLKVDKDAQVLLELAGETLELISENDRQRRVHIPAGGEVRVEWRVKAVAEGTATVRMKGLTDEESDAMQMEFPVFVHGMLKTESFSGVLRPQEENGQLVFNIPEDRRADQSRLEIRYSPTLAGAMVDALPYLVDYPYGCTEQTLNRFIPTVVTQGILKRMNLDLAAIAEKRTNLNAQEIGDDVERASQWKRFQRNPVFDVNEVDLMVKKGVQELTAMQNSDGGWGWFSGYGERSYPHTTAVVVHGLQQAQNNDIAIVDGIVEQGVSWLQNYQAKQVELLQEGARQDKNPKRRQPYKTQASEVDALVFSVLVDAGIKNDAMQGFLYRDRLKLSLYSQSLLGLALDTLGETEQRDMIVRNIDQFMAVDNENQTAYLDLPNNRPWWYWYGSHIEANAHYLKLLVRVSPNAPKAAGLVKYILNQRKHGTYWTNTRDTAYCIEALADYLKATDELSPELTVEVWIDGQRRKTVEINRDNLFSFDNSFVLEGNVLTSGEHTVELRKTGKGPLYHNAYLSYFSLEDFITKTGLEIKVERKFYKLVQDEGATTTVSGSRGQVIDQRQLKYTRVELQNLDEVASGDLIEVELEMESKNDYEYIIFEDFKAAGTEPVDIRSGYTSGGLGAYVEFRDERVAFFMRSLQRGKHSLSYRLRAEIPGKFSALPARAYGMYAPELKANSDELKIKVSDSH